ncbi:MAG: PilZ domain-containing protein [Proteobacteria bacterium]|nr:PilZ domain-containing protein [Pseudomonadota bacterium]
MFSIKGIYKNKTIHLLEPLKIKKRTNVIITFMNEDMDNADLEMDDDSSLDDYSEPMDLEESFDEIPDIEDEASMDDDESPVDEEFSEEYYSKIRKHKRYIANGNISLVEDDMETIFPLFDYSAGGLSFISDKEFDVGIKLTASIKDPIEQDMSVLDFEFEVARIVDFNGKYKVGCKFFDEVDEEIWHSLMG